MRPVSSARVDEFPELGEPTKLGETVLLHEVSIVQKGLATQLWIYVPAEIPKGKQLMPNTHGARTADEAVRIARLSQAMGETAPLIIIGMIAFIPDSPDSIFQAATVMPAQIFTWASGGKRSRISNLKRDAGDVDSDPHQGEEK